MTSWHAYPSIYNLGHRAVADLFKHDVYVEEKVDGSQFSFGLFEEPYRDDGDWSATKSYELRVRSKGAVMNINAPERMFERAVETVKELAPKLHVGWTYRCEYLAKPKHNTLAYDRVPGGYLIGFDISTGDQMWLNPIEKRVEFNRLGLETVPILASSISGEPLTLDELRTVLDNTTSVLGGQLIEGVVVKPFGSLYGPDKKTLMGKFVSERFKESHKVEWKASNPSRADVVERIIQAHARPARYNKAIQHLREVGALEDSPRDIGKLLQELERDVLQEEGEVIAKTLMARFWPDIARGIRRGFPEYYKQELLRRQFEQGDEA